MFLHELNKDEKKSFWVIANYLSMVDGVMQDEEQELLDSFDAEMNETFTMIHPSQTDFRRAIDSLKDSTERIKRIVYFALFGIAAADGEYTSEEERMIELTRREFLISDSVGSSLERCLYDGADETRVGELL